jgi:hypothetical protein
VKEEGKKKQKRKGINKIPAQSAVILKDCRRYRLVNEHQTSLSDSCNRKPNVNLTTAVIRILQLHKNSSNTKHTLKHTNGYRLLFHAEQFYTVWKFSGTLNCINCGLVLTVRKARSTEFLTGQIKRTRHFESSEHMNYQISILFQSSV